MEEQQWKGEMIGEENGLFIIIEDSLLAQAVHCHCLCRIPAPDPLFSLFFVPAHNAERNPTIAWLGRKFPKVSMTNDGMPALFVAIKGWRRTRRTARQRYSPAQERLHDDPAPIY